MRINPRDSSSSSQNPTPEKTKSMKLATLTPHIGRLARPYLLGAILCMSANPALLAETYTITEIKGLSAAQSLTLEGLNDVGQVVGNTSMKSGKSTVPGPAFVWTGGSSVLLPGLSGAAAAEGRAISGTGLVTGHSPRMSVYSQYPKAVWWQPNGSSSYTVGDWNSFLPAGSSIRLISAVAISSDGQFVVFDQVDQVTGYDQAVVGRVDFIGGQPVGFSGLWHIGSLDGTADNYGFVSAGTSITHDGNGAVRATGYAKYGGAAKAFLWELNALDGTSALTNIDPTGTAFSQGNGVNNSGEAAFNVSQAFFRNSAGLRLQLPTLGGARSYAHGLNDAGSVVGWSQRSGKNASNHAFIWSTTTGIRDLNVLKAAGDTSGIELTSAERITPSGKILASGVRKNASVRVLLQPIP